MVHNIPMPIDLRSQKSISQVRNLKFCYLCGKDILPTDLADRDHVPPSGVFLAADRNFPLILPTHKKCNGERSQDDQLFSQLIGHLYGKGPNEHHKLEILSGIGEKGLWLAVFGVDFRAIIRRCVQGFHAALYQEYLPDDQDTFMTIPPLPEALITSKGIDVLEIPEVAIKFVEELKRNRATKNLDMIVCRNSKCQYECVWAQAEDGRWLCIYGFAIYNWIQLGDTDKFPGRGCVGCYWRHDRKAPRGCATSTKLDFPLQNQSIFDPFGN